MGGGGDTSARPVIEVRAAEGRDKPTQQQIQKPTRREIGRDLRLSPLPPSDANDRPGARSTSYPAHMLHPLIGAHTNRLRTAVESAIRTCLRTYFRTPIPKVRTGPHPRGPRAEGYRATPDNWLALPAARAWEQRASKAVRSAKSGVRGSDW